MKEKGQKKNVAESSSQLLLLRSFRDRKNYLKDTVVKECAITVLYNGMEMARLVCTPTHITELAVGYLFFSGTISCLDEIEWISEEPPKRIVNVMGRVRWDQNEATRTLKDSGSGNETALSSFGTPGRGRIRNHALRLTARIIKKLAREFYARSDLHLRTGGAHACGLANQKQILIFREDISRYSAIDKVAGKCIMEGIRIDDPVILTTGRIFSEIVIKANKLSASFLVSRGAPTDLGVSLAKRLGITLIGFCRADRMNIYSHPERVLFDR